LSILYAIDFDDTLNSTEKISGEDYNPIMSTVSFCKGKNFVILTARRDTESNRKYVAGFLKKHSLPYVDMHFTGGALKGPVTETLLSHSEVSMVILIDDNKEQRGSVTSIGNPNLKAYHPNELSSIDTMERKSILKDMFKKVSRKVPAFFKQNRDYINYSDDDNKTVEFTNELGNDIKIKVEKDRKDGLQYYYVNIVMEGPSSVAENTITEMEAKELKKILNNII
jgi:hypothetical protein